MFFWFKITSGLASVPKANTMFMVKSNQTFSQLAIEKLSAAGARNLIELLPEARFHVGPKSNPSERSAVEADWDIKTFFKDINSDKRQADVVYVTRRGCRPRRRGPARARGGGPERFHEHLLLLSCFGIGRSIE